MTAVHEMLEWIYVYFIIATEGSHQIFYDWPLTTVWELHRCPFEK